MARDIRIHKPKFKSNPAGKFYSDLHKRIMGFLLFCPQKEFSIVLSDSSVGKYRTRTYHTKQRVYRGNFRDQFHTGCPLNSGSVLYRVSYNLASISYRVSSKLGSILYRVSNNLGSISYRMSKILAPISNRVSSKLGSILYRVSNKLGSIS